MTGGLTVSAWAGSDLRPVDDVVATVDRLARAGFEGVWLPQTLSVDALTALAVAAREVHGVHLGTAVVPIQGRHPGPGPVVACPPASSAPPWPPSSWPAPGDLHGGHLVRRGPGCRRLRSVIGRRTHSLGAGGRPPRVG